MSNTQTMRQYAAKRIDKLESLLVQADLTMRQYQNLADVFGQTLCGMAFEAGMRLAGEVPAFNARDVAEVIAVMDSTPERQEERLIQVERG